MQNIQPFYVSVSQIHSKVSSPIGLKWYRIAMYQGVMIILKHMALLLSLCTVYCK